MEYSCLTVMGHLGFCHKLPTSTYSLQLSPRPSLSVCFPYTPEGNDLFIHLILPASPQEHPLLKDLQIAEPHSFVAFVFLVRCCFSKCIIPLLLRLHFSVLLALIFLQKMQFPIAFLQAVHLKSKSCSRSFLINGRNKYGGGEILMSPPSGFLCLWFFIWFEV